MDRPVLPHLLTLHQINKRFGSAQVLRDINLTITEGEFVCFLGPSGCGKSTLLRIVAGLERQTAGQIFKSGQDISTMEPAQRDVGILFQSYALFPNLTVRDNVAYGLAHRGLQRKEIDGRVAELLALVDLPDTGARLPGMLSGGQQQRVALARALAPSPKLLLLDEPLSALDAKVRLHLRQQITQLQRRLKLTTIMVTHDQEEALTMADRVVVMNHGVIEQVGTPQQIYGRPATRFVADFVGKMNFFPARALGDDMAQAGSLRLQLPMRLDRAGPITLGFRPEELQLASEAQAGPNSWPAQVEAIEFLGSGCRASLRCPQLAEQVLTADCASRQLRAMDARPGSQLHAMVPAEHLHVFFDDKAGPPA